MTVTPATQTVQAAVITGPQTLTVERVPLPEPGPGEVRLRLEGCGVCGSNLPPWEGRPWFEYPFEPGAPGHEGWGYVDALGEGVTGLKTGDRVTAISYHAYATHDLATADAVVKLPEALADTPFPGEPLGCAMNVFERSDIQAGQTVAVVGVGFLGGLLAQLATGAGARVLAISRRPFSLELAKSVGAAETVPLTDRYETLQRVMDLTNGEGCDRVIEAVGTQEPLTLAGELTRVRGRLIIAGYHQDGPREVNMQLWNWRGFDVVNAHERDPARYTSGMRRAVEAVVAGTLDPTPLLTHTFTLDKLGSAFEAMQTRPDGFLKALVTF